MIFFFFISCIVAYFLESYLKYLFSEQAYLVYTNMWQISIYLLRNYMDIHNKVFLESLSFLCLLEWIGHASNSGQLMFNMMSYSNIQLWAKSLQSSCRSAALSVPVCHGFWQNPPLSEVCVTNLGVVCIPLIALSETSGKVQLWQLRNPV